LGTPDKLKYPLLVDAVIDILNVLNQTDMHKKGDTDNKEKITFSLDYVQFSIVFLYVENYY